MNFNVCVHAFVSNIHYTLWNSNLNNSISILSYNYSQQLTEIVIFISWSPVMTKVMLKQVYSLLWSRKHYVLYWWHGKSYRILWITAIIFKKIVAYMVSAILQEVGGGYYGDINNEKDNSLQWENNNIIIQAKRGSTMSDSSWVI